MNYEKFKNIIEQLELFKTRSHVLYKNGVDLMSYDEPTHKIINDLMSCVFDEESIGWIDWYLYERVGMNGDVLKANDAQGNPICFDISSLWKEVKLKNKNYEN